MKKPPGYDKKPKQKYAVYCRAKYYEWQHIGDTFILDDSRTPTIPNNANLNDYTTAGTYRATSSSVSATLSNCPVSNYAIKLFVIETGYGSSNYCMQIIVAGARSLYFRTRTTNAWTVWGKISYTDV